MFKQLAIILVSLVFTFGCATKPVPIETKPVPVEKTVVSTDIFYEAQRMNVNYDIVHKKAIKEIKCYIVVEILTMPGENNVWAISGFRKGDYIVMYGNRPGFMATLHCRNNLDAVQGWFRGKAAPLIRTEEGWYVERLRLNEDGTFTLRTVIVSVYNLEERYFDEAD